MSEELARRAVACKGWRWMPGMLGVTATGGVWRVEQADLTALYGAGAGPVSIHETGTWFPDLTDPATVGCLLALVREAAQEPGLHVRCMLPYAPDMSGKTPPPWVLYSGRGQRWGDRHETEAEALVAALEAAP